MILREFRGPSTTVRILGVAVLWLGLISLLHAYFNREGRSSHKVLMGYMPVITNLAAPLLDSATLGKDVHFEAVKFASFAEMAEAFRSGHIQVAFIIAPLSIVLHEQGVPLKVVYIGNRHESTLVVRKDSSCNTVSDLVGKTVAVPIRYSGHLLALERYLREHGFARNAIHTVEIPPPDMPAALASGAIEGYFVGEPFASKAIESGIGRRLAKAEEIWPKFICNIVIVREELIHSHRKWVEMLVSGAARSGFWARDHIDEATKLASRYWGQDEKVVSLAFNNPPGRVRFDLFIPILEEFEGMEQEMRLAGLMREKIDLHGMLDDSFAKKADVERVSSFEDIVLE